MKRMVLLVTLGLLFAGSAIAADATLEGSADFESTHRGGATTKGKLFGLGKKIRTESEARGTSMTMIMDTEAQKMWMLVGTSCMEQSLAGDPHRTSFLIPEKGAKEELVGTETIDGHPTEKYKITTSAADTPRVHYVWRAKDLKGFPVQTSDEAGTSQTKFTNIVLAKPDAKLFQPPAGCKPMPKMSEIQKQLDQLRKGPGKTSPPAK